MQSVYEASIDTIAKHYGLDHQQMKCIEEMGEASSAIARHVLERRHEFRAHGRRVSGRPDYDRSAACAIAYAEVPL